ncbi:MAG: hypothetical protein AAF149_20530 [Bacteroidota bacterium]
MPNLRKLNDQWKEHYVLFGGSGSPTQAYDTTDIGFGKEEDQKTDILTTESNSSLYTGTGIGQAVYDPKTRRQKFVPSSDISDK